MVIVVVSMSVFVMLANLATFAISLIIITITSGIAPRGDEFPPRLLNCTRTRGRSPNTG